MGAAAKLMEVLMHPDELPPLLRMRAELKRITSINHGTPEQEFCYCMLNRVSRSFSIVIQQLPECLRDPVCVFYLVLRALDTVEDDMAFPDDKKLPLLDTFHERIYDPTFRLEGCGEQYCKELLEKYPNVTAVFLGLTEASQAVIKDITKRMGAGMHEFIEKDVITKADYDLYCHYVAGLVGIGLCHLFAASGCEAPAFADSSMDTLANHMGLFLQKTNIIRDYLEDVEEIPAPRMFWPKEIWSKHADRLQDFAVPSNRKAAVLCLNEMIDDALDHFPFCVEYMNKLTDAQVFSFCAIPQIMAISTLALCYNNPKVFEGVVKMRRGQTAAVFGDLDGMASVYRHFFEWGTLLREKVLDAKLSGDPTAEFTLKKVENMLSTCQNGASQLNISLYKQKMSIGSTLPTFILSLGYLAYTLSTEQLRTSFGLPKSNGTELVDQAQVVLAVMLVIASGFMLYMRCR